MGDVSAEPSMEDILSSIKRIIAEEGDVSASARARRAAKPAAAPDSPTEAEEEERDEVLELSDPVPTPRPDAKLTSQGRREQILSEQAAQASRGALESLSRLVVKPEVTGSDTLQGLVESMLRPMLRDWLDAHLPELVEKMVAREITRITGQE
jgi:cell pole-organizing protein PopZ